MQYDKNRFKVHALPHPLLFFWILYPGAMFSELIFGRRLPKVTLIDKESDKPLEERSYVPCPHCETLHDRRLWSKGNAFGHWFGLLCPSCHQIIPCLWNIFSLVILTVTFPLWCLPVRFFRDRWVEKEKERLAKVLEPPLIQATSIHPLWGGIDGCFHAIPIWVMWVIFEVVWKGKEWDLETMTQDLLMALVIGFTSFITGCFMTWVQNEKEEMKKEKERLANVHERPLIRAIRAKSIKSTIKSIRWFLRGAFYIGGGMWVVLMMPHVLDGRDWDFMFDMLPLCLLGGFIVGCFMHVSVQLELPNLKGRKS